jgi:selenocysteine-specific elongation factor
VVTGADAPPQLAPVILGTAGHIDHGKTSLTRALTGIDTDRLKEEKQRGITIELGFAHLDAGGRRFGLVDVPGHERFLRAMVAGAGGVDVVMLVIAADEGIMPQTREHLDVCELLGIRHGVVALTKRDLVDDDWLELVTADVRAALEGSFLAGAAIVPVSAVSGAGLDDLKAELVRLAARVSARSPEGPLRLPVDRVFTMKGFGTVVTGTILGGRIGVGDGVVLLPGEQTAKVRGLQVHGAAVQQARAGTRCAVNLGGAERDEVARGDVVALAGGVVPTHLVDARLRYLGSCRGPLKQRQKCLLHHGTAQVEATIVLADRVELAPGDSAVAQLHLDAPIAALPGDRFILRGFEAQAHFGSTIGGGEVVRVHPRKLRRADADAAATIRKAAGATPAERIALEAQAAGPAGVSRSGLLSRTGLSPGLVDDALARLSQSGELLRDGDLALHAEVVAKLEHSALASIDAYAAANPHKDGIGREEVRTRLPGALPTRLFEAVLAALERRGAIVAERDLVARKRKTAPGGPGSALTAGGAGGAGGAGAGGAGSSVGPLAADLLARFGTWGLEAPRPDDVPGLAGAAPAAVKQALEVLVRTGKLVRIKPDYFVDAGALAALRQRLRAFLLDHGQITAQEWKTLVGATRKYTIPLAEHFDAEKLTLRVGEIRRLRG